MPHIDLVGAVFGRLRVLCFVGLNKDMRAIWRCACDCGETTTVISSNLTKGSTKSCGCLRLVKGQNMTHGGKGTRLYRIWSGIKNRCLNENEPAYPRYGGRGIRICDEWLDFAIFREWSLGAGYKDNLSIDRKENDGNYEPTNCRWATAKEQAHNRRAPTIGARNHLLVVRGETNTVAAWGRKFGIGESAIRRRIKLGWNEEAAVTTPKGVRP